MYEIKYEEFEIFISKIDTKVKVFTFITLSEDILYFDAIRWKQIISKYLPELKRLFLVYLQFSGIHCAKTRIVRHAQVPAGIRPLEI